MIGVNALDRANYFEKFLGKATVFRVYDAGNIGMQMRKIWGLLLEEDFDPRAIADSGSVKFKKSTERARTRVADEQDASTPPLARERK